MQSIVPLVSSSVAGPLGAVHLPRLWCKVILDAKGLLPEGYDVCGAGFDQMVLDGLHLDREKTLKYLQGEIPSYPEFEKWVVEQNGGQVDGGDIAKLNEAIKGYIHSDDTRGEILAAAGLDDSGAIKDAVNLNNLDDWSEFHQAVKGA